MARSILVRQVFSHPYLFLFRAGHYSLPLEESMVVAARFAMGVLTRRQRPIHSDYCVSAIPPGPPTLRKFLLNLGSDN